MPKTRISLALPTIPREPNTNKDAEVKNAYIDDSQTGNSYVVKRPGFYVGTEAITVGNARGIYVNPNAPNGDGEGETLLWYISEPTPGNFVLNSISSTFEPPEPPVEEELVISADFQIIDDSSGALASAYYIDPDTGLGVLMGVIALSGTRQRTFTVGDILNSGDVMYSDSLGPDGTYKITKTPTLFYCYFNNVLLGTYPYQATGYTTTQSTESNATVTDIQAGTPEG